MKKYNSEMNIHFPQQQYQQTNDHVPLIIGLGFLSVMLFGLVVVLLAVKF
jgi:hypothetical protein